MAVIEINVFKRINVGGLVPPPNHRIFFCRQARVCVREFARARCHNMEMAGLKILN